MCFSAQEWADYRKYVREFGADISIREFVALYCRRKDGQKVKIPKGMDLAFANSTTPEGREIWSMVEEWNAAEVTKLEQEMFKQAKRLADAERTLQTKTTKKALDDQRIAGNKVSQIKSKLADLKRTEAKDRDSRIFPMVYGSVMVWEAGRLVVKPMRYGCRLNGKPLRYDDDFSGTYNARRDNLEKYWQPLFGRKHALMVVETFYENVEREGGRNEVLQFTPKDRSLMYVACLWDHWQGKGKDAGEPDLLSFAAITDDPEPEVAAAGHDRTIINIKPEHVEAWLNPDPNNLAALHAIFDDRQHPYYEHRLAA
jgi:putative SOS response-associated peptidase YedK